MARALGSRFLGAKIRDFSVTCLLPFWQRNGAKRMLEVIAFRQSNLLAAAGVCAGLPPSWNENLFLKF
jgi:hypothetical protein